MRITQSMMVTHQVTRLQTRLERFERAQSQLGTGKSILKPSDDPSGANRGLMLRAAQRAREQEQRNGADARTWLDLADSKLQNVVTRLHRARDLMVTAASNQDGNVSKAMATEIAEIQDEITALANSEHGGRPLFAGTSGELPVAGERGGPWTYEGNDGAVDRRVGENDTVRVNVTATQVFGTFGTNPSEDLFSLLDQIHLAMEEGRQTDVSTQLGDLDQALKKIGDAQGVIGAATNRVDAAMERNADAMLAIRGELAEVEDVDVAEAVMELQTQEVAYQASLSALSRVLQPSLVDFLR